MPRKASIKATKPKRRLRLPSLLHRQSADHQGGKWPLLESCYREERNNKAPSGNERAGGELARAPVATGAKIPSLQFAAPSTRLC
jgi:hypothetical protein